MHRDQIKGNYEIVIKNYKYCHLITKEGFPKIGLPTLIRSLCLYAANKLEKIISFIIVSLMIFKFGIILIPLVYFFIFKVVIDTNPFFKMQKTLIFILQIIAQSLAKDYLNYRKLIQSSSLSNSNMNFLIGNFLLGSSVDWKFDLAVIFLLFVLFTIYNGQITKKYFPEKEFFGEACYRIVLNEQYFQLGSKLHFDEQVVLESFRESLRQDTVKFKHSKLKIIERLRFYLAQMIDFKKQLLRNMPQVFMSMKEFNSESNQVKNKTSFYWRIFSYHNVVHGKNKLLFKILACLSFFFFNIYFYKFSKKQNSQLVSDQVDNIEASFLFNIVLSVVCILLELIFNDYQTMKWNHHIKIKRNFTRELLLVDPPKRTSILQRMRKVVLKMIYSKRLQMIYALKQYKQIGYHKNSYYKKYQFNSILYATLCILYLIFWPSYDEDLIGYSFHHLVYTPIFMPFRIMLFFMIFYLLLCNWDNNIDKKNDYDSILNNNYDSPINSLVYKVYMNIPFITEIKTVLTYISSKTALDIFKWFKVEDIKRTLVNAYYIKGSIKRKKIGVPEPKVIKFVQSYLIFFLFFILLVAPLFFFSNLNFLVKVPNIRNADLSIEIHLMTNGNQNIGLTLARINNFQTNQVAIENLKLSKVEQDYFIQEFQSNIQSLKSQMLSSHIYNYDIESFDTQITGISFSYKLILQSEELDFMYEGTLNDSSVNEFKVLDFLKSGCNEINKTWK